MSSNLGPAIVVCFPRSDPVILSGLFHDSSRNEAITLKSECFAFLDEVRLSAHAKFSKLQVPDEALSHVMSMGFKECDVRRALRLNNQDIGRAIDFLSEEKAKRVQKREDDIRYKEEIMELKQYGVTPLKKAVNLDKLKELMAIGFEKKLVVEVRLNAGLEDAYARSVFEVLDFFRVDSTKALISFVLALINGEMGLTVFLEPSVILLILVVNAAVGVITETNAEKALEELRAYQVDIATVLRNGQELLSLGLVQTLLWGSIRDSMLRTDDKVTPLKKKLDEFGIFLAKVIAGICVLVWIVNIGHFRDPAHGGILLERMAFKITTNRSQLHVVRKLRQLEVTS
ncbi:hypothetical protein F3Y22_tig00110777pilonHSYRG00339 [Hibiscus syriacus]|uniref:UBA domain-containing protein n=1 Tax=Hibiscus syriacus TaxID=106335 RepID=A0A6A2ZS25_HIBSY|nr:hypothetical protein F3Y22_tig00110777pilonHSYRG00339 [Hibiscus syriacus]